MSYVEVQPSEVGLTFVSRVKKKTPRFALAFFFGNFKPKTLF